MSQRAAAQGAEVRVLASNGIKAVLEDVLPQAQKAIGHPISVQYRPTSALKKDIDAGAEFDVVIVTVESISELSKEGKTVGGEGTPISRVGVGIGIRKGAPRPDISTPEAIKRAIEGKDGDKKEPGKDLVVLGSAELVQSLMRANLVDEYMLLVHPLVLGIGRRLFDEGGAFAKLQLVDAKPTTKGVIIATYRPA